MKRDPKHMVATGYDDIADAYLERFGSSAVRQKWLDRLIGSLPAEEGRVLDVGCGAGLPVARDLAERGHHVVGIDASEQQIVRARHNVPTATFIHADMIEAEFEPETFDGIGAFYSLTHLPSAQQGSFIRKIAKWLKPGGVMIASFGTGAAGEWTGEWMGTTMFFGHAGEDCILKCLGESGLKIRCSSVEKQDNEDAEFLWVEALRGR